jgi:small conductance mechanosensitive channel
MTHLAVILVIMPPFPDAERLVEMSIRIALTVLFAFLVQRVLFFFVGRLERWIVRAGHGGEPEQQRVRTLSQTFRHLCTTLVAAAAVIHILAVLGWDVRPLLAGAGIIGVALGFGAQTLIRDWIAGVFILAENQFAVGDLIEVNGKPATVEAISLRSTRLRDFNGYVHFVPNGEMKVVTNRSRGWTRLAVDVMLAADQDIDRALEVIRATVAEMNEDATWSARTLDPIDVWGVESLGGIEVQVRIVIRSRPGADAPLVTRELRQRLLRALSKARIRTGAVTATAPPPVAGVTGRSG